MYEEYSMGGVEDLLDFFDTEKTAKTIEKQIMNDDFGLGPISDFYRPYYTKFKCLEVNIDNGLTETVVKTCREKARVIALMFIDAILKKYQLTIDEFWIENLGDTDLQGLAVVLYDFFILHIREMLLEVFTRYIDSNAETLAKEYESNPKLTKDAALPAFLQIMPQDYAVIGANIFDVCFLILNNLNEEEFIDYIDSDNELQPHIKKYFEDGHISGNFIDILSRMLLNTANGLKGYIGFELLSYLKRTYGYSNREK